MQFLCSVMREKFQDQDLLKEQKMAKCNHPYLFKKIFFFSSIKELKDLYLISENQCEIHSFSKLMRSSNLCPKNDFKNFFSQKFLKTTF